MRWIHAAVASLLAVAACDGGRRGPRFDGAGRTEPYRGGTLTTATQLEVSTLDPAFVMDEVGVIVLAHLHDTLLDYDQPGPDDPRSGTRLVPRLAERWSVSPDGLRYQFTLRAGARYADGRPIVAGDVAHALRRVLRAPGSPHASHLASITGAAAYTARERDDVPGLEVDGDRVLRLTLDAPDAAFAYVLARRFSAPVRPDVVGVDAEAVPGGVPASGPFMLARWDRGQRLVLARNPHYVDPARPHLDRIVLLERVAQDSAFLMFEAGALDALDHLTSPDWQWISDQPAWRPYLHTRPMIASIGSRMNVGVAPFDDVRVRRALNHAVNQAHTLKLLGGLAVPAHGMLPPGLAGRAEIAPYPYDPARARALLAEAGYPDGFAVDYVTTDNDEARKLAQSLQADLATIGVRVTIRVRSWPTYLEETSRPDGAPLSMTAWNMDYPDPASFFDTRFHSRAIAERDSYNDSFYRNPALDRLLDEARRDLDPAGREARYRVADQVLHDEAPWIWGYHPVMMEVTQAYVKGYPIHPVWGRDFREVWLDLDAAGRRVPR